MRLLGELRLKSDALAGGSGQRTERRGGIPRYRPGLQSKDRREDRMEGEPVMMSDCGNE